MGAKPEMQQTEILTWQMFGDATQDLARMVLEDGFKPDQGAA